MKRLLFAYEQKNSFFHRCDPISKVIWLLCFSAISWFTTSALPQAFLLTMVILTAVLLAKIGLREAGFMVTVFMLFALCWFLIQSLLIGGNQVIIKIGPFKFAYEGVNAAGAVALRSVVMVGLARIFIGTTEPRALALALVQRWKLSYTVAFSIFFMMRLLPLFEQEFVDMQDARKIRAADLPGLGGALKTFVDYTKVLLVRGFRRSVITSYSLECRAFRARPHRTFLTKIQSSKEGGLLLILSLSITLISIFYNLFLT